MKKVYIDTNIFINLTLKKTPQYKNTKLFFRLCTDKDYLLLSSAETIQEIIHIGKNRNNLLDSIKLSKQLLRIINELLPVTTDVINKYLDFVLKYPQLESRDCIHLATCIINNINFLITYDKALLNNREKSLRILTPEEFLSSFT